MERILLMHLEYFFLRDLPDAVIATESMMLFSYSGSRKFLFDFSNHIVANVLKFSFSLR